MREQLRIRLPVRAPVMTGKSRGSGLLVKGRGREAMRAARYGKPVGHPKRSAYYAVRELLVLTSTFAHLS